MIDGLKAIDTEETKSKESNEDSNLVEENSNLNKENDLESNNLDCKSQINDKLDKAIDNKLDNQAIECNVRIVVESVESSEEIETIKESNEEIETIKENQFDNKDDKVQLE